MQTLSLTDELLVRERARAFYDKYILSRELSPAERHIGLEIEFSVTNADGELVIGSSPLLAERCDGLPVCPELGSYQIEINPPPECVDFETFKRLHSKINRVAERLVSVASGLELTILPAGLPFLVDEDFFTQDIYTRKRRYQIITEYFEHYSGSSIEFDDSKKIFLPGATGVTVINELHVQIQALNQQELIDMFNYSQMISPLVIALGANSGFTNGKQLKNQEHQVVMFESCEGIADGRLGVQRVGLFPGYITSLDDYFDIVNAFRPLYIFETERDCFEVTTNTYFGWTRIRHGESPQSHLRTEFRPLSTQPTILENVALSEFYARTLLRMVSDKPRMLPFCAVQSNFYRAVQSGIHSSLLWDLGDGMEEFPAGEILQYMLPDDMEFLDVMRTRIATSRTAVDRLAYDHEKYGGDKAKDLYLQCFHKDEPYIK